MQKPPFKLATPTLTVGARSPHFTGLHPAGCCDSAENNDRGEAGNSSSGRSRLSDLDSHLHCSVIGTCLGTPELRKLMARFIDVQGLSDLDVHHEAVRLACAGGLVPKALNKALDQKHESAIRRFKDVRDEAALGKLWDESLRQGEVPGTYWAVLTHRAITPGLRQRVFGDVHMLSHLVGAANRADIRRLVALENHNADLQDRLERQVLRSQQLLEERDAVSAQLQQHLAEAAVHRIREEATPALAIDVQALNATVALQTARRERAEADVAAMTNEAHRLRLELDELRKHSDALANELSAAEVQLREQGNANGEAPKALTERLMGRRILYVGGRPSSTPAIRDLVQRHGGEFQRHDGGLEDRKGLLESAVAWAELVIFPVDCVDHDSAGRLKRLCMKQGTPFVPLRSASVACFAAAITDIDNTASVTSDARRPPICLRHG